MTFNEVIETFKIFSVVSLMENNQALITRRPYRSPHRAICDQIFFLAFIFNGQRTTDKGLNLTFSGRIYILNDYTLLLTDDTGPEFCGYSYLQ
jgi:hypothetical protein